MNMLTPNTLTFAGQGFLGPQAAALSYSVASGTTTTGTITGSPATVLQHANRIIEAAIWFCAYLDRYLVAFFL
jgi:hypothetical protein